MLLKLFNRCGNKRFYFKNSINNKMKVITVPVNNDNFSYLVIDEINKVAVTIDPCQPNKVIAALPTHTGEIKIEASLTTHHHWDHAGGNNEIKTLIPGIKVYGGDERIEGITKKLEDNEVLEIGSLSIKTLNAPAHTKAHVLYLIHDKNSDSGSSSSTPSSLFTGDTLFIGGCGRLFEGNPEQMYHALYNVIGKLPDDTLVYVGHEYTLKNLQFAKSLESSNQQLNEFYIKCQEKVENKLPTVPSTVGIEKQINPFMRCHLPSIYNNFLSVKKDSSNPPITSEVLGYIRELKDKF